CPHRLLERSNYAEGVSMSEIWCSYTSLPRSDASALTPHALHLGLDRLGKPGKDSFGVGLDHHTDFAVRNPNAGGRSYPCFDHRRFGVVEWVGLPVNRYVVTIDRDPSRRPDRKRGGYSGQVFGRVSGGDEDPDE